MGNIVDEIIKGRKVFFIAPDHSLLPENYLEEYLTLGYECYFIDNDIFLPMETKVEIILSIFKDSILFFNIDAPISTIKWPSFILNLQMKYPEAIFGVLYNKRQSVPERQGIERQFLYTIGIKGGCIQLEYQKRQNFEIIEKILFANQAQGRRKNIRAICTPSCTYSWHQGAMDISGTLQDISLSHFTLISPSGKLNIQLYEKVNDFHFNIRGFLFRSDAVLIMERDLGLDKLYVFSFVSSTGANGLDPRIKQLFVPNIYKLMSSNCKSLLDQLYTKMDDITNNSIEDLPEI